jgi:hypothetical protein
MSSVILGHCTKDRIVPQLGKRLTNGASQAGRDQTPEKQSNAASKTTVNLDNQFQNIKTTHNRNEKNANNGIRVAISFSAKEAVIASCQTEVHRSGDR